MSQPLNHVAHTMMRQKFDHVNLKNPSFFCDFQPTLNPDVHTDIVLLTRYDIAPKNLSRGDVVSLWSASLLSYSPLSSFVLLNFFIFFIKVS